MNFLNSFHPWLKAAALSFLLAGAALAQYEGVLHDVKLVDSDGDHSVRYRLDGSRLVGFTNGFPVDSWTWTWPGGSAVGEFPEVDFTTASTPLTITLTLVTSQLTLQDSFELDVLATSETFHDLSDPAFITDNSATDELRVEGGENFILIKPESPELPQVYGFDYEDGSWNQVPPPTGGPDIRTDGGQWIMTGNFHTGESLEVHYQLTNGYRTHPILVSTNGDYTPFPLGPQYGFEFANNIAVVRRSDMQGLQVYNMSFFDGNLTHVTSLTPETPLNPNDSWGDAFAVNEDLIVVTRPESSGTDKLTIFKKNGSAWERNATLQANGGIGGFVFEGPVVIHDASSFVVGVVDDSGNHRGMIVEWSEEDQEWKQTLIEPHPMARQNDAFRIAESWGPIGATTNQLSLVYELFNGNGWRTLPTPGFLPQAARGIAFAGEGIVAYQQASGKVLVYNYHEGFNSEPIIDAGLDITAPANNGVVTVSLDGSRSYDPDGGSLTAIWSWDGGTAEGLQTTATIDPSVTSITLKIVDPFGIAKFDTVNIYVPAQANAGSDQVVLGNVGDDFVTVRLDASATFEGTPGNLSYEWWWSEGVANGEITDVVLPVNYLPWSIRLRVTDSQGNITEDWVDITAIGNRAPVAKAGSDKEIRDDDNDGYVYVRLDASASTDIDGDIASYTWSWQGGTASGRVTEIGFYAPDVDFPVDVTLTVTDKNSNTSTDTLQVTDLFPSSLDPTADAGQFQALSDTDGDGFITFRLEALDAARSEGEILSYKWTWDGGSAVGRIADVVLPVTNTPVTVTLTVTDADSNFSTDIVGLTTFPAVGAVPVAKAGPDQVVRDTDSDNFVTVSLDASASTDPDNNIVSYVWSWPESIAIGQSPDVVFPVTNSPVTVTLTVTDQDSNFSTDTLIVYANQVGAPVAKAGPDHVVADHDGNNFVTLQLNASASTDEQGDIVSYEWTWPGGGNTSGAITEGTFPATNSPVTVTLTVTDAQGLVSTDTLVVTAYKEQPALFTDITPALETEDFHIDDATMAGEMFLLSNTNESKVFRRDSGTWIEESSPNRLARAVTSDLIVRDWSIDGYTISRLNVSRYVENEWVNGVVPMSDAVSIFGEATYATDLKTLVIGSTAAGRFVQSSGRVYIFDWDGDYLNFKREISPPGGRFEYGYFGASLAVDGDLVAATNVEAGREWVHVYSKQSATGEWLSDGSFDAGVYDGSSRDEEPRISIVNGVILLGSFADTTTKIVQKINNIWVQTSINTGRLGVNGSRVMSDDGNAFVTCDERGNAVLYTKNPGSYTWSGASFTTRRLLTNDLVGRSAGDVQVAGFSQGNILLTSRSTKTARIIDTRTTIHSINVEPIADAGADINANSSNGGPVRVTLNGTKSRDLDPNSSLSAVWTWPGGSANGLRAFANIPPSVTEIELKVIDNGGAISRDTIQVNIAAPPLIEVGPDVTLVDTDGDGRVRLKVNGTLLTPKNSIVSWIWTWPGGSLNGQSGTITLDAAAHDNYVTLTVLDSNGFSNVDRFLVRILAVDPPPIILKAADGVPGDEYGASVAIENGTAMVSAPRYYNVFGEETGATYLLENVENSWQEQPLSQEQTQGTGVLIDGDTAFVAASNLANENSPVEGGVYVYERQAGFWNQTQILGAPSSPAGYSTNDNHSGGFGSSMAKSGNWLAIGARDAKKRIDSYDTTGVVFLFEKIDGSWTFRQIIASNFLRPFSSFGVTLAIYGDSLVVTSRDLAEVFTNSQGFWSFTGGLKNPDGSFARSSGPVVMNETELFLGIINGKIVHYSKDENTWTYQGSYDGHSLFLRDNFLLTNLGRTIYTYRIDEIGLVLAGNITLPDGTHPTLGGGWEPTSLGHDGSNLIVGSASDFGLEGRVYIYENLAAFNVNSQYEPHANAGPDISVTDTVARQTTSPFTITEPLGSEPVTLNASASTDQENSITSYAWTWPGGSATGVTAPVRFPVGTTVVTLTVTDNQGIVNSDTVNVTVALDQTPPATLPSANNTLTVNLPVPGAKWRLSSEFLWHASGESADDVILGQPYQLEIIGYPGSKETVTTLVTPSSTNFVANLTLILPLQPTATGTVSFPETAQGFSWRLRGEPTWRNVLDDGDAFDELISATVATGELIIDYKPVTGYATPASQLINMQSGHSLALNWNDYQRIDNFDLAKTFTAAVSPNLSGDPFQYVGMIRTPLGRGTGTVVAPRVVLTAAHLFFDSSGLQWADTQWFPRQQQETRQSPPITPRGILYQTAYAQIVAPDSVQTPVATVPADKKEADFAVLYFTSSGNWEGGSSNYLQSTTTQNWLTGTGNKQAVGYPQRSQQYEQRGKIFGKNFATALSPVDSKPLPLIYETGELFGDGGASGSALFVQPQGATGFYPAAILLAGQDRAVYRVIDQDVGRMIQDAQDAASGNNEVLNNNFSLVTYGGSGLRALKVGITTPAALPVARWSVTPNVGTAYSNLTPTQLVGFSNSWANVRVAFSAVPGFITPPSIILLSSQVTGTTTIQNVVYEPVSGYDLWKQSSGITSDSDDRDGDGKSALAEYAINGNINSGTDPAPIRVSAVPLQNTYAEFEVFISSTADKIRYTVKASNTLPGTNVVTLGTFTKADGTNGYKRVTDDTQPKSASSKRFAWVEYTHDRNLP